MDNTNIDTYLDGISRAIDGLISKLKYVDNPEKFGFVLGIISEDIERFEEAYWESTNSDDGIAMIDKIVIADKSIEDKLRAVEKSVVIWKHLNQMMSKNGYTHE